MNEKNPLEGLAIGVKPKHILTGVKGHYLELEVSQWPIICVGVYVKNKRVDFLPCTKIEVVNQMLDLYQNDIKVANLEGINVKMKEEIESYLSFCFKFHEILVKEHEDDKND